MREKIKAFREKYKKIILIIIALWVFACLVGGGIIWRKMIIFNRGAEYMELGDYTAASAQFEKIGRTDKMEECAYLYTKQRLDRAVQLMEDGELETAKAELAILGEFENAAEMLTECELRLARQMIAQGDYSRALNKLALIEEHPGALELMDQAREQLYQQAIGLAYECKMDEAMQLFNQLGDYKDARAYYKRCSDRIVHMLSGWSEPVNYAEYAGLAVGDGIIYWHRLGLIYVPKECNAETTAMIFFPGGYDQSLANGYMETYLYGYYGELPNAIMLFCYANGMYDMEEKIADAHAALEQAAMENNVFLHDVTVMGASNGAYTAAHAAVWLYENQGIRVKNVLALDAGQHWASFMPILSTEDCDVVAKAGTAFYLLEGDGVGMNILAIQTMVAHKMDVSIIHAANYGHYSVIYDAMQQGIFSWLMGGGERPENDNYTYIKLDKDSKYPN